MKKNHKYDKIEKSLLNSTIIFFLILIFFQSILLNDKISMFLNRETINHSLFNSSLHNQLGNLTLKINNDQYKNIEVFINGDMKFNFKNKSKIKFEVYDNDLIEINGSMYEEKVNIYLVNISDNIKTQYLKTHIATNGNIKPLGQIRLK
ncbi:hypothetical protein [Clostridiisalibacter paucivorans]|uniref:hypothetical protein n=1 Tax=Clostridiisalibacter paucivorans TaxID=408753 RepID=UPI00047E0BE5|nr:hypothetical protein [Clostridiisalibacter paucivorans]